MKRSLVRSAGALLVSGVTVLWACGGGTAELDTASALASATGSVKASRSGAELVLDVHVEQLAPPAEVKKGATEYVVWARPARGGPPRNLGVLKRVNDVGDLRAKIAAETMSLIVTAEPSRHAGAPTGETLLWAYVEAEEDARRADGGEPKADEASQAEPHEDEATQSPSKNNAPPSEPEPNPPPARANPDATPQSDARSDDAAQPAQDAAEPDSD
jgi:hypothetical protein